MGVANAFLELGGNDCHGGDWAEWPNHLRVREFPGFFHEYGE
jgi:hypothetical protein